METVGIGGPCIAIGLVALCAPARADEIEFGGYAGVSASNVHTTYECPPPSSSASLCSPSSWPHQGARAPALGSYLRIPSSRAVMLEANLLYVQKGYDVSPRVRVHYLEAPLLVRFDPLRDRPTRVFAHAGVAPAVRVWCSASGVAFDNDLHEAFSYAGSCDDAPFPRTPTRFDLGGVIGFGGGGRVGPGSFEVQVRVVLGLVDVGGRDEGIGKTVNNAAYLLVGYGI